MKPIPRKKRTWLRALWEERANLIALVGALTGIGTLLVASIAAGLAYREWMRHEAAERATVIIKDFKLGPLVFFPRAAVSRIVVDVENKGEQSAREVLPVADLYATAEGGIVKPQDELRRTCSVYDSQKEIAGDILSGKQRLTVERQVELDSALFRVGIHGAPGEAGARSSTVRLAVCVIYKDEISGGFHHTGQVYELTAPISAPMYEQIKAPSSLGPFPELQPEEYMLRPFPFFGKILD